MNTIARPYAAAAFEYASAKNELPAWEAMLQTAADIAKDPTAMQLLRNPNVTEKQLSELFCELLASLLNVERKNFIRLLAVNKRLSLLPDIAAQFQESRAALEKKITVQVASATELTEAYQQKLVAALTKRLQRQVELQSTIDPTLLGGVLIHAGDTVIDGSIRGKLTRMIDFI